jgi:hypothetical protein
MNKDENQICNDCGTEFTTIKLIDIPEDKLIEQRKRYRDSVNPLKAVSSLLFNCNPAIQMAKMFQPPSMDIEIMEEDAGEKQIHEQNRIVYNKRCEERERLKEETFKYKELNRNDICICGSGKKYKQCCLFKYQNL